jgi:hypothetical protein
MKIEKMFSVKADGFKQGPNARSNTGADGLKKV